MIVKKIKLYTIPLLKFLPDHLFIFGDNLIGKGNAGQAIIRDEPNSYGIPTKKLPSNSPGSFFDDSEYKENCKVIQNAIDNIPSGFTTIVFPEDGLGTGLANLPKKAPKTYEFLKNCVNERFGNVY